MVTGRRPARVALGLGASCGAGSRERISAAVRALSRVLGEARAAPLIRSPPLGPPSQPDYLNTVVAGLCAASPEALLAFAKRLELAAGRRSGPRWGPRPLDIDLLVWDDLVTTNPELRLPHPGLAGRRFVLEPLSLLAADWPALGVSVQTALSHRRAGAPTTSA